MPTHPPGRPRRDEPSEPAGPAALDGTVNRFVRAREARRTEVEQDYVELIDDLIAAQGEARIVTMADILGVSQPTVTKTIGRLVRAGLVTAQPYRSIFLTEMGRALAARSRERHLIVRDFLIAIGVSPETAETDAEGLEHHISEETQEVFARMASRLGGGGG